MLSPPSKLPVAVLSGFLGAGGRFDDLLVKSTGLSEPLPVAETFTFRDFLQNPDAWHGVPCSEGSFCLTSRMDLTRRWCLAGGSANCEGAGTWCAASPKDERPAEEEALGQFQNDGQEHRGNRRQELVFISVGLEEVALRAKLDAALLTKKALDARPKGWRKLRDPFPAWTDDEVAA